MKATHTIEKIAEWVPGYFGIGEKYIGWYEEKPEPGKRFMFHTTCRMNFVHLSVVKSIVFKAEGVLIIITENSTYCLKPIKDEK